MKKVYLKNVYISTGDINLLENIYNELDSVGTNNIYLLQDLKQLITDLKETE